MSSKYEKLSGASMSENLHKMETNLRSSLLEVFGKSGRRLLLVCGIMLVTVAGCGVDIRTPLGAAGAAVCTTTARRLICSIPPAACSTDSLILSETGALPSSGASLYSNLPGPNAGSPQDTDRLPVIVAAVPTGATKLEAMHKTKK